MASIKLQHTILRVRILLRILVPIALLSLPANFFDEGKSLCISKLLFNQECPACGLTRACMHLIHFDFEIAYEYNMFCFISFPALAIFWLVMFLKEIKMEMRMNNNK